MIRTACALVTLAGLFAASRASAHDIRCAQAVGFAYMEDAARPRLLPDGLPWLRAAAAPGVLRIEGYPTVVGFDVAIENVAARDSVVLSVEDSLDALDPSHLVGVYGARLEEGTRLAPGERVRRVVLARIGSYDECLALGGEPPVAACLDAVESRFRLFHESGSTECRARLVCEPQLDPWVGVRTFGDPNDASSEAYDVAVGGDGLVYVVGGIYGPWLPELPAGDDFTDGFLAGLDATGDTVAGYRLDATGATSLTRIALLADGTAVAIASVGIVGDRVVKLRLFDGAELWSVDLPGATDVAASGDGTIYVASATADAGAVTKLGPDGGVSWTRPVDGVWTVAVAVHPAGGAYVAGLTTTAREPLVARFDEDGGLRWQRSFGAAYGDSAAAAVAGIAVGPAGEIYAAHRGIVGPPGESRYDAWLVRMNGDGAEAWRRALEAIPTAVATGPGGIWAAGTTEIREMFVEKLDGAGDLLWLTRFGNGFDMDGVTAIAPDAAGALYVVGWSEAYAGGRLHGFVAKIGAEGVVR